MEGTFIEVEAFGDFDMKYTEAILYSEEKRDVEEIQKRFCEINGLPGFKDLQYFPAYKETYSFLGDITKKFIEYLKTKEGFKVLKTKSVYFCD